MTASNSPPTANGNLRSAAIDNPADAAPSGPADDLMHGAGFLSNDKAHAPAQIPVQRAGAMSSPNVLSGLVRPDQSVRPDDPDAETLAMIAQSAIMPLLVPHPEQIPEAGTEEERAVRSSKAGPLRRTGKHLGSQDPADDAAADPTYLSALLATGVQMAMTANPSGSAAQHAPQQSSKQATEADQGGPDAKAERTEGADQSISYSALLRLMTALTTGIQLILKAVHAEVIGLSDGDGSSAADHSDMPLKSRRRLNLK